MNVINLGVHMPAYSPSNTPEQNLAVLAGNTYPGRLLVVGHAGEKAVLAYALTGRSEGSRNRRLVLEDNVVNTEIADTTLSVGDPDITVYDAMRRVGYVEIVSNGNQTDRVVRYLRSGKTFADAMQATHHEPDAPHFTPRITGFHDLDPDNGQPHFGISVVTKDPGGEGSTRRLYTDQSPESVLSGAGDFGYCVHTYRGDANPLQSFDEAPFPIPTQSSAEDMAEMLWETLDRENRVAVVAKTIGPTGVAEFSIINRHE